MEIYMLVAMELVRLDTNCNNVSCKWTHSL